MKSRKIQSRFDVNLGHKFEAMHRDSGGYGARIPTNQPQLGPLIPGERSPYVESVCGGTRTKSLYLTVFGWIVEINVSDFIHELIYEHTHLR